MNTDGSFSTQLFDLKCEVLEKVYEIETGEISKSRAQTIFELENVINTFFDKKLTKEVNSREN